MKKLPPDDRHLARSVYAALNHHLVVIASRPVLRTRLISPSPPVWASSRWPIILFGCAGVAYNQTPNHDVF